MARVTRRTGAKTTVGLRSRIELLEDQQRRIGCPDCVDQRPLYVFRRAGADAPIPRPDPCARCGRTPEVTELVVAFDPSPRID
jgi:hypothetical protein